MNDNKIKVSSKNGNEKMMGSIIIKNGSVTKEVKAVMFSSCEAKVLNFYIDKMPK